jgi:short-subunit dehydrogenase
MDSSSRSLAVVTGASSGIGLELARQFAEHDFDLIIAAEDADIAAAAQELQDLGAAVEAVQVDLATPAGVQELHRHIVAAGRPVDAIALNAGVGAGGAFATDTALEDELRIVDLNVRSTVHLAKLVIRDMVARGAGRMLFTSSIASTMPGSFQAVYNASKSFVQSFALALRNELKDTGVTVTSLMPGPTETEFFERADMLDTKVGSSDKDDPADVARDGWGRARRLAFALHQGAGAREPLHARQRQGRDAPPDGRAGVGREVAGALSGHGPTVRSRRACRVPSTAAETASAKPRPRASPLKGSLSNAAPPRNPTMAEYVAQDRAAMPSNSVNERSGYATAPAVSVIAVRAPGM